jgi:RNA polymerase sigma factor (sigma-70 family)
VKGRPFSVCSEIGVPRYSADCSDDDLLERFVTRRDEAAFAALVARHGPMVFGVCRRLLRHAQDTEDAFQATFLILIRKAASIGRRELLANWLYGVAARVAARARLVAAKRRTRETTDMERVARAEREPAESTELPLVIEEEVRRLPAKYRGPVVLCYLEGRTNEEAAGELHWPVGTVKGRLARAREMLRKRLTRRGLALSTAAFSAALSAEALAAPLPPVLVDSTLKAAMSFAAGDAAAAGLVSAQAAALTKGVLHTMFMTKMKMLAAMVLVLAVLVGGTGALSYHLVVTEADAKKTDKENIQGEWKVDSAKMNGQDAAGEEGERIKNATFEFTANKLLTKFKDETRESTYKLDPTAKPKTIDIEFILNDKVVETTRAIYKLEGDTLTIRGKPHGGADERPTEFESKEGGGTMLIVLKRVKK